MNLSKTINCLLISFVILFSLFAFIDYSSVGGGILGVINLLIIEVIK
jgi:hypothetical protein